MIKQAKIIEIKTEATKPKKQTWFELKSFRPDTLLYYHLLLNVNGAKFEMKTVKMGSEKSSNQTNVPHIKRGSSTRHIFIYIFL